MNHVYKQHVKHEHRDVEYQEEVATQQREAQDEDIQRVSRVRTAAETMVLRIGNDLLETVGDAS